MHNKVTLWTNISAHGKSITA